MATAEIPRFFLLGFENETEDSSARVFRQDAAVGIQAGGLGTLMRSVGCWKRFGDKREEIAAISRVSIEEN